MLSAGSRDSAAPDDKTNESAAAWRNLCFAVCGPGACAPEGPASRCLRTTAPCWLCL